MINFYMVDLSKYVNNKGITSAKTINLGNLTLGGSSLPLELLENEVVLIRDIPFSLILSAYEADNIELDNQEILLETNKSIKDIYILGNSIDGDYIDSVSLLFKNEIIKVVKLKLSSITNSVGTFGNIKGLSFSYLHNREIKKIYSEANLWVHRIKLCESLLIDSIKLSDTPFMHVFAITLLLSNK